MRPRCRVGKHQGDLSQLWRFNFGIGPAFGGSEVSDERHRVTVPSNPGKTRPSKVDAMVRKQRPGSSQGSGGCRGCTLR